MIINLFCFLSCPAFVPFVLVSVHNSNILITIIALVFVFPAFCSVLYFVCIRVNGMVRLVFCLVVVCVLVFLFLDNNNNNV